MIKDSELRIFSSLNNMSVFAQSPAARIDHVLARHGTALEASMAVSCFTEPCVSLQPRDTC